MDDLKVTHNRLAWDEYFAAQALLISNRATCNRAKVGAVLVKDNKVIATGYNGSVSGTDHCLEDGCLMVEGHCVRTIHAEVNAILQGAERGIPKGFTAYVTHFPCLNCTKQLLQVGCKRVVYIHQYRIDEYAEYLYREKEVPDIIKFLETNGYSYPCLMDHSGIVPEKYHISAFPTTYLINGNGEIQNVIVGGISEGRLKALVDEGLNSLN